MTAVEATAAKTGDATPATSEAAQPSHALAGAIPLCLMLGSTAAIAQPSRPLVGAIRWDAWSGGEVTRQVERTLGPARFHARLPWFAEVTGEDAVRIDGGRQEIMDREIGFAAAAGLDYWAFLLYPEANSMSESLRHYLRSGARGRVNFCLILHNAFGVDESQWPHERDRAVALLREPGYQTVLGGRPLVYAFQVTVRGVFPAKRLAEFRRAAQAAGVDPYCVFMGWNPGRDFKAMATQGFDAVSAYACGSADATFAQLCQRVERDFWQNAATASVPYVPLVTTGWDKTPRKEHPVSWELDHDYHRQSVFPATATPAEIATHLERAMAFVQEHAAICPANTVIIYSWNEHDEGGWLVPTWTPAGVPDSSRLEAIGRVLGTRPGHAWPPSVASRPDEPGTPAAVTCTGDWQIEVAMAPGKGRQMAVTLPVAPPAFAVVTDEICDRLPDFAPEAAGWRKGVVLQGVRAQECTARHALDPTSLRVTADGPTGEVFERGRDYQADLEWGTVGRLAAGRIAPDQRVWFSYRHGSSRIDSVVLDAHGVISLRPGVPHVAMPLPPELAPGETRLANLFVEARLAKLDPAHIFPILEQAYPELPPPVPSVAATLLPKTLAKLTRGDALHILAWGDSVTDGSFLPGGVQDRWQEQFVERLRRRFPHAPITLTTEAWGGRNTAAYLAEPSGSPHNYRERVLAVRPDLVLSEFVNDAGLTPAQVDERYGALLADFQAQGAEWIILTPHYVRPDWMGLTRQREIDNDPRPYVHGLREFAVRRQVALADASLRWGRLWRQGLPYNALMHNTINHPDVRGMRLFADSLMALF